MLLPLATDNVLTLRQVEAILRNGENSNDYALRRSTLPFTFVAGAAIA